MVVISRPDRVGGSVGYTVINGRHTCRAGYEPAVGLVLVYDGICPSGDFCFGLRVDENIDLVRPN